MDRNDWVLMCLFILLKSNILNICAENQWIWMVLHWIVSSGSLNRRKWALNRYDWALIYSLKRNKTLWREISKCGCSVLNRIPGTFERKALNAAQNWLNFDQCAFKYSFKKNTTLLKQKVVWICIWILYWMSSWWSLKRKLCTEYNWLSFEYSFKRDKTLNRVSVGLYGYWSSRLLAIALILILLFMIYMNFDMDSIHIN